jgi:hypothetical protein
MPFLTYVCTNGHVTKAFVDPAKMNDGAVLTGVCPVDAAATTLASNRAFGAPGTLTGCAAAGLGTNTTDQTNLNGKSGGPPYLQGGPAQAPGANSGQNAGGTYPGVYGDSRKNLL